MSRRPQINSGCQLRTGHGMFAGNAFSTFFFGAIDIGEGTRSELCYTGVTVNHRLNDFITAQQWSERIEGIRGLAKTYPAFLVSQAKNKPSSTRVAQ